MNKMFTAMIAVIALLSLTACGGDKMMKKMIYTNILLAFVFSTVVADGQIEKVKGIIGSI